MAMVDAIATVDETGEHWAVAVMNRHPSESVSCTIELGPRTIDGSYRATLLTGDSPDAWNDIEHPRRVAPRTVELVFVDGTVDLPPHSLAIVDLSLTK